MNLRHAALALLGLVAPGWAMAADMAAGPYTPPPAGTSSIYIVTVSANAALVPSFPGSDRVSGVFYPALSFRRSDEPARFTAPDDGISISVLESPSFRIGPVLRYESGRYYQDDNALRGLRKLPWDVEAGLFVEYWPVTFLRARLEARHGVRGDSGFVGNAGLDFVVPTGKFTFSLGPRLTFGDDDWAFRYFGVTALEATRNSFVFPYRPRGGITSVGGLGSVMYTWNETWATTVYAGYNRLTSDIADSPIVTRIGSRDQYIVGARLSYSFNFTPFW